MCLGLPAFAVLSCQWEAPPPSFTTRPRVFPMPKAFPSGARVSSSPRAVLICSSPRSPTPTFLPLSRMTCAYPFACCRPTPRWAAPCFHTRTLVVYPILSHPFLQHVRLRVMALPTPIGPPGNFSARKSKSPTFARSVSQFAPCFRLSSFWQEVWVDFECRVFFQVSSTFRGFVYCFKFQGPLIEPDDRVSVPAVFRSLSSSVPASLKCDSTVLPEFLIPHARRSALLVSDPMLAYSYSPFIPYFCKRSFRYAALASAVLLSKLKSDPYPSHLPPWLLLIRTFLAGSFSFFPFGPLNALVPARQPNRILSPPGLSPPLHLPS